MHVLYVHPLGSKLDASFRKVDILIAKVLTFVDRRMCRTIQAGESKRLSFVRFRLFVITLASCGLPLAVRQENSGQVMYALLSTILTRSVWATSLLNTAVEARSEADLAGFDPATTTTNKL